MNIDKYVKNTKKLKNLGYVELTDIYNEAKKQLKDQSDKGIEDVTLSKFLDTVERLID